MLYFKKNLLFLNAGQVVSVNSGPSTCGYKRKSFYITKMSEAHNYNNTN